MAQCTTEQWVSSAPQVRLTVTESASTETTSTLSWTLQYIATYPANANQWVGPEYSVVIGGETVKAASNDFPIDGLTGTHTMASGTKVITKTKNAQSIAFGVTIHWALTWSGVYCGTKSASGSISIAAKTSYTVKYALNGGSGSFSSQTKWHDENVQLHSHSPSKTGHTFKNWLSSAQNQAYNPGYNYGHNASTTMQAQWTANTFAVTYDANGGSGAPASQTKTYGVNLTLSSTIPTRTNYNFIGWATSASATTATYAAGSTYTGNTALKLYAVWELAYVKPVISGLKVSRCNSSGATSDDGTYALLVFGWATDRTVSSITVTWVSASGGSGSASISASGTSGAVSQVIGGGAFSTEATYTITVTVTDSGGSTPASATLPGIAFAIDFKAGGKGVAFGKPAEREGYADFAYRIVDRFGTEILNGLAAYTGGGDSGIDPNTTLEELILTSHSNCPEGLGTFYFIRTVFYNTKSTSANRAQIAFPYNKSGSVRHRYFASGAWSSWSDPFEIGNTNSASVKLICGSSSVALLSDRFRPSANDILYLGDASNKWKAVYAVSGTIQTSDRNKKKNIKEIDERYVTLFDLLQPVTFEYTRPESDRVHTGFVSQDVKAAMDEVGLTELDFAGFCRDIKMETVIEVDPETGEKRAVDKQVFDENGDPVYVYSLRYSEFIALNSKLIKRNRETSIKQQQEIEALKYEVAGLKALIADLMSK